MWLYASYYIFKPPLKILIYIFSIFVAYSTAEINIITLLIFIEMIILIFYKNVNTCKSRSCTHIQTHTHTRARAHARTHACMHVYTLLKKIRHRKIVRKNWPTLIQENLAKNYCRITFFFSFKLKLEIST